MKKQELKVMTDCGEITVRPYDDEIANGVQIFLGDTIVAMVDCYRKAKPPELPTKVLIPISEITDDEDEDWISVSIGNVLSDKYGFCVFSFNYQKKEDVYEVTNIKWDTSDESETPEARLLVYGPEGPDFDEPTETIRIN